MIKVVIGLAAGLLVFVVGAMTFMMVVMGAGAISSAAAGGSYLNPSQEALDDVPPLALDAYMSAALSCPGLPWQVLAGIGRVESNHGRHGGAVIDAAGWVRPEIIGIALDGSPGIALIRDTDGGEMDGDVVYDRAVGPMQFIPSTWVLLGVDADGDGHASPHNIFDATLAAAAHLCPTGELDDVRAALFSYNRSWEYVDLVLEWAARYTGTANGYVVGDYALPLPLELITANPYWLTAPHHDYPAWDAPIPVGTPLFAMTSGTVTVALADEGRCGGTVVITGNDGHSYVSCHLSSVMVVSGQEVAAGQQIGLSGGMPGAIGAGNTTGPHLHQAIRVNGVSICPQAVLVAIYAGAPIDPAGAPRSGCTF